MWGQIAGAVIGGLMSSDASSGAAKTQAAATDRATASNERMFNKQVDLQKPFRDTGVSANNRLVYLMGLSTDNGTGGGTTGLSYDVLRQQLAPQYTKQEQYQEREKIPGWGQNGFDGENFGPDAGYQNVTKSRDILDQGGLDSEILRLMRADEATRMSAAQGDSNFGSLLKDFSTADFEADPGYAFRMSEGMKGVEGGAAARGGLLSGAALKAIQNYGQGLASQEYGNAYGRFTTNQTNKYNKLAGLVNSGQGATNQLTNAAGNLGASTSQNILASGEAQAAGQLGQANAWNKAIGGASNAYQINELMNLIRKPGSSSGGDLTPYLQYQNADYSGQNYSY